MRLVEKPTPEEVSDAIFGKWEGQRRKPGLLERISRIEKLLLLSVPVLVARALGVPTDVFGRFFVDHGGVANVAQHVVAFFIGFPK
jgi:hypothetical protein